jgi:hypothetical protein
MNAAQMMGIVAVAALFITHNAAGHEKIRATNIKLPENGKTASYRGTLHGYDSMNYIFKASAGQMVGIDLKTRSTSTYFNVAQDGKDTALFVGTLSGSNFDMILPDDGIYCVKVYQMRYAARRRASAQYELDFRHK